MNKATGLLNRRNTSLRQAIVTTTSLLLFIPNQFGIARNFSTLPTTTFAFQQRIHKFPTTSKPSSSLLAMTTMNASTESEAKTQPISFKEQSEAYQKLIKHLSSITQLERAAAVLSYDEMVFMPGTPETAQQRGLQKGAMASVIHEKAIDPNIPKWIDQSELDLKQQSKDEMSATDENDDDDVEGIKALLRLSKKSYRKKSRVPPELVSKEAELTSRAYVTWVKARSEDKYDLFEPILRECFDLAKVMSDTTRDSEEIPTYNEMLDRFEVGMQSTRIDALFSEVKEALVPLIERVLTSETKVSSGPLTGKFEVEKQKELSEEIVKELGFDTNRGRIDVSVHPFTTSFSPMDVRITSRFKEEEWYQGLAGSVHECGHAIYEQNLGNSGLEVDTALSMGMHESQSLFWERHIGLSKPFWKWATPRFNEKFGVEFTSEEMYGAVNVVSQSFIRVEADELTYPLHVILRYGIERDVIEGSLDVKDIPERWNQDMKAFLNIDVPSDAKGCLQDVHWTGLAFGYFPTYLIGSMTAAQLAHYCKVQFPDMDNMIEKGEFKEIREWLTEKIHKHGSRYESLDQHLEDQLGEKLNPKYFIQYLTEKYSDLYKC